MKVIGLKIKDLDIYKLIQKLEWNAWNREEPQTAYIFNENNIVEIYGYTHELSHELFSTTHTVKINDKPIIIDGVQLGIETTKKEIEEIEKYLGEEEIFLQYNKPILEVQKIINEDDFNKEL